MGRREQKKAETARRIAQAGRVLFRRQGYDMTTTQEIAIEAGIPPGTLFGYITTKSDILVMALLDEALDFLSALRPKIPSKAGLIDQVMFIYTEMQAYHSTDGELFGHFLRELSVTPATDQSRNGRILGNALRDLISEIIARHQAAGALTAPVSPYRISELFFAHYWQCIRFWAMGSLSQDEFAPSLREALTWQVYGLGPQPADPPRGAPATAPATSIAKR